MIVEFYVENQFNLPDKLEHIFGPYFVNEEGEIIYAERKLVETKHIGAALNLRCFVHITRDGLKFVVNNLYLKLIRFQLGDWLPPGIHLFNLIQSKLLLNGMSLLHSACVSSNDDSILILAKPNTGKTSTVFDLVVNSGLHLLSEDLTLVDSNGFAYSCPYTSTYFNNRVITNEILARGWVSERDRIRLILNRLLPPIPLLSSFGCRPPSPFVLLHKLPLKTHTKIRKLVFLQREYKQEVSIDDVDKEEAFKKVLILNRAELRYYRDPLIVALSYCKKEYDIERLLSTESRILKSVIDKTEQCYLVKADSPQKFVRVIGNIIKEK
jgi:hypothetical protein